MGFQTVLRPELAERYRHSGLWTNETFFAILEARAKAHPEREAFADGAGRITYGELKEKVERCAAFLRRIGIKRGDVVTIQLPNRIAFPVVFFALELIGAIANKVNPDFRMRELDYILRVLRQPCLRLRARVQGLRLRRHGPGAACTPAQPEPYHRGRRRQRFRCRGLVTGGGNGLRGVARRP